MCVQLCVLRRQINPTKQFSPVDRQTKKAVNCPTHSEACTGLERIKNFFFERKQTKFSTIFQIFLQIQFDITGAGAPVRLPVHNSFEVNYRFCCSWHEIQRGTSADR